MVNVIIHGEEKLILKMERMKVELINSAAESLGRDLALLDSDAKQSVSQGSRSGRIYKRKTVTHQASAPGEYPKTDRGFLVAGFLFNIRKTFTDVYGYLENRAAHAAAVEFKPISKGGRPFMRPLFKKWNGKIKDNIVMAMRNTIKRISNV